MWEVGCWLEWPELGKKTIRTPRISQLVNLEHDVDGKHFRFTSVTVWHEGEDLPVTYTREDMQRVVLVFPKESS